MQMLEKYKKELIFICLFCISTMIGKNSLQNVKTAILLNIFWLFLSLWYLNKTLSFGINFVLIQILHGLWSAILILLSVVAICFLLRLQVTFNIHILYSYEYIYVFLFQLLIAITEELVFRASFYRIFRSMHMNKMTSVLLVSFMFGLLHFYMHGSLIQLLLTTFFSLSMFVFMIKVKNYLLISCISAHFFYGILAQYIIIF